MNASEGDSQALGDTGSGAWRGDAVVEVGLWGHGEEAFRAEGTACATREGHSGSVPLGLSPGPQGKGKGKGEAGGMW